MADKPAHPILRFIRQLGPAGPVAVIATALPAVGALVLLAVAPPIIRWLHAHGLAGAFVFMLAYAIFCGFALVPTYASSILGGWTFKFGIGYPAVMAGIGGAAVIAYTLAHRIVGHRVRRVIHEHPKWEVVRDALVGGKSLKAIGVITLLRLSPLLPFETTNVLLASCEVRLVPFLIGTLLGVAPRTAAVVFIASRARKLEQAGASSWWLIALGIVMTVVVLAAVTIISKKALDRATRAPRINPTRGTASPSRSNP
jgi:uncharacterized membrane protein YdjX (TVP38/TMEM64 family)